MQVEDDGLSPLDLLAVLASRRRLLTIVPILAGALAVGASYLMTPMYTAQTVFVPPQQSQSSASSALASLGALAGLAGGGGGMKTAGDQYVSLMQSVNVEDRLVDHFKLMDVYQMKRAGARHELERNTRIALGKRDGLITVEVDASSPTLAADIANQYVAELRRLTGELALTEAQQRRAFFESEVKQTRVRLEDAQGALQAGGFNGNALKAEPKAAAEGYAQLKASLTSAEVRLQTMRRSLADSSNEIQQQMSLVQALRSQLAQIEASGDHSKDSDYLTRYREFKYQEALFELFSKQYEMARVDESRESAVIQVVDAATPPEGKSKPRRGQIGIATTAVAFLLLALGTILRHLWREARANPANAARFKRLDQAWRGPRS